MAMKSKKFAPYIDFIPLQVAAYQPKDNIGLFELVMQETLLYKPDVHLIKDYDGNTLAHLAALSSNNRTLLYLLEWEFEKRQDFFLHTLNKHQRTALDICIH